MSTQDVRPCERCNRPHQSMFVDYLHFKLICPDCKREIEQAYRGRKF